MKILIVSHNCFSTHQNMGKTFLSLFSGFAPEELCQLYIYPSLPDTPACGSCYRVTDRELLTRLHPGGEIDQTLIRPDNGLFQDPSHRRLYRNPANGRPIRRLLRDALWQTGRWNTRSLQSWLDREDPDCIFLAPGYAKFIYDIALRISRSRNVPIVTWLCDDYYFAEPPSGWTGRLYQRLLNRKISSIMECTTHLVTITPEMAAAYTGRFAVPATVIMTGAAAVAPEVKAGPPHGLCYFGNIRLGRNRTLACIGRELDAINKELGTSFTLDLYTAEEDRAILSVFDGVASVRLRGFVTGEEFRRAMSGAELLLHVEDWDGENARRVRFSLSTKIPDSLGSGIPLVACGPAEVSSMAHLLRNECALTATAESGLRQTLLAALLDGEARARAAANGLAAAERFHCKEKNSALLRDILTRAAEPFERERNTNVTV